MPKLWEIWWFCPECETENMDTYGTTAEPMCEKCYCEPGWNWILKQPRRATLQDYVWILNDLAARKKEKEQSSEDQNHRR